MKVEPLSCASMYTEGILELCGKSLSYDYYDDYNIDTIISFPKDCKEASIKNIKANFAKVLLSHNVPFTVEPIKSDLQVPGVIFTIDFSAWKLMLRTHPEEDPIKVLRDFYKITPPYTMDKWLTEDDIADRLDYWCQRVMKRPGPYTNEDYKTFLEMIKEPWPEEELEEYCLRLGLVDAHFESEYISRCYIAIYEDYGPIPAEAEYAFGLGQCHHFNVAYGEDEEVGWTGVADNIFYLLIESLHGVCSIYNRPCKCELYGNNLQIVKDAQNPVIGDIFPQIDGAYSGQEFSDSCELLSNDDLSKFTHEQIAEALAIAASYIIDLFISGYQGGLDKICVKSSNKQQCTVAAGRNPNVIERQMSEAERIRAEENRAAIKKEVMEEMEKDIKLLEKHARIIIPRDGHEEEHLSLYESKLHKIKYKIQVKKEWEDGKGHLLLGRLQAKFIFWVYRKIFRQEIHGIK